MDWLKSWIWRNSTKDVQENKDDPVLQSSLATQQADNINKTTETKFVQDTTEQHVDVLNKSNNAKLKTASDITTILISETQIPFSGRVLKWIQKNTYLQPDDCLPCKLIFSSGITVIYIGAIQYFQSQRKIVPKEKHKYLAVIYVSLFYMWARTLQIEWYNATFKPPSLDRPRNFAERMKMDFDKLKLRLEKLEKHNRSFQNQGKTSGDEKNGAYLNKLMTYIKPGVQEEKQSDQSAENNSER